MPDRTEEKFVPDVEYVVFRKCTPSWRMYEHEFHFCNITYMVKGNAQYTIDGKSYNLSEGDLLCLPKGSIRAGITYPDRLMHCFSVDFQMKNTKGEQTRLPFPVVCHIGRKYDLIHLFLELSYTWLEKQPGYSMKACGLFLLILQRLFELIVYNIDSESGDFRIKRVTRYIAANYAKKITVKKMAEMSGLNSAYFGTLFKRETGLTLNHFLIQTRIKNAENMLMSGEYTVGETAEACGFSDVIHFYKHFKRIIGFPPSRCIPKKSG